MSDINTAAVAALRSIIDSLPPKQAVDCCPTCGTRMGEAHTRMCDDQANENMFQDYLDKKEDTVDIREFLYHSNKKGMLQTWSTDFNTAAFFMYKDVPYMLINGQWGVVCFNLNRAFWATDKTVIGMIESKDFDFLTTWPTAQQQTLLLNLV